MKIVYLTPFQIAFKKLSPADKDLVLHAISLFEENPHDPILSNHALKKPMAGRRAISAWDDLRIIFREKRDYMEVLMLDVGDHARVCR